MGGYASKCWLILLLLISIYLQCWQCNQPNEENRTKTLVLLRSQATGQESANRWSEWAGRKCWYFQKISFPFLASNGGGGQSTCNWWELLFVSHEERGLGHRKRSRRHEKQAKLAGSLQIKNIMGENKKLEDQVWQNWPGWGPSGPCISVWENSSSQCLENTISVSFD